MWYKSVIADATGDIRNSHVYYMGPWTILPFLRRRISSKCPVGQVVMLCLVWLDKKKKVPSTICCCAEREENGWGGNMIRLTHQMCVRAYETLCLHNGKYSLLHPYDYSGIDELNKTNIYHRERIGEREKRVCFLHTAITWTSRNSWNSLHMGKEFHIFVFL